MCVSLWLRSLGRCLRTGTVPIRVRDPGPLSLVALLYTTFTELSRMVVSSFWVARGRKGHDGSYPPINPEAATSLYISMARI